MLQLVCIDASKHSRKAFDWYCDHIHRKGVKVGLVHAHEVPAMPVVGIYDNGFFLDDSYESSLQESAKESKKLIEDYEKLCKERGIETMVFLRNSQGSPGETICNVVRQSKASMVVIGQRGLGVIRRTLMGSVSDYVLHHSNVPTLVIPSKKK
ncbi:universal stress protein YxiE-like [Hydractinia symbiolongicarpus]|uniref:universal stress protein YxiE-like n=1 Tax=Hydractinia symbiolongicarpus TaxID=13093 RepID=UPI00254C9194|nr:universal stress protein YxiE-like [Hydractinia symbiolongicarpus]